MEKSEDSGYNSPAAAPGPYSPPNSLNNNNNPFRNKNALNTLPPPPYEAHITGDPFADTGRGDNDLTQSNQVSAQTYPDEKSGSKEQRVCSYQPPQGPPQQQQFYPQSGPSSSNQYGDGYNLEHSPRSVNQDSPSNDGGSNWGFSPDIKGSYSPQAQPQYPQHSQQQLTYQSTIPRYQSSPDQFQSSAGQSGSSGLSRGVFDPQHFDPNQPSVNGSGGSGGGVLAKLGGKNPLDPPPLQFSRPPPGNYPYIMFPPMVCLSVSSKLDDGWPILPPPTPVGGQHPFMSHDITEEDWIKFLKDMKQASSLSGMDRLVSNGIPLAMGMSFVGGLFASHAIDNRTKDAKIGPLGDLIDTWNNYFFNPRRINVVLAQGNYRFSGRINAPPPDITGSHRGYSSSYSDSDSDSGHSSHSVNDSHHRRGNSHGLQGGFLAVGSGGRHCRSSSQGRVHTRKEAKRNRRADRRDMLLGGGLLGNGGLLGGLLGGMSQSSSRSGDGYDGSGVGRHGNPLGKWRLVVCFWDGSKEVI